jgi:hypothetical protein
VVGCCEHEEPLGSGTSEIVNEYQVVSCNYVDNLNKMIKCIIVQRILSKKL